MESCICIDILKKIKPLLKYNDQQINALPIKRDNDLDLKMMCWWHFVFCFAFFIYTLGGILSEAQRLAPTRSRRRQEQLAATIAPKGPWQRSCHYARRTEQGKALRNGKWPAQQLLGLKVIKQDLLKGKPVLFQVGEAHACVKVAERWPARKMLDQF